MYAILQHSHSGLRYVSLFLLIYLLALSVKGLVKSSEYSAYAKKLSLITSISFHIQLLIGFALYFISPKVVFGAGTMKSELLRFFTVEHALMMLIAIVLITIGNGKAKRKNSVASYKSQLWFGGIGLLLLLAGIPWPFREALGAGWF